MTDSTGPMIEQAKDALDVGSTSFPKKRHPSPETRARMSASHLGMSVSLETHLKHRQYVASPEARAKISKANQGKVRSPEIRAKLSVIHTAVANRPEVRARNSAAHIGKGWKGGPRATWARVDAERRQQGFHPLNSPFPDSDGHHINVNDVIYMPHGLHHSIYHNQRTGRGMAAINALAGAFLGEDWT